MTADRSIVLLHGVQSSSTSWWRVGQDLRDLGWQVHALDLRGHGSRPAPDSARLTLADLAADVKDQVPGPVDVVVGHSLGSLVALTLVQMSPDYCQALVIEDPPGLAGGLDPAEVATNVERSVQAARTDGRGTIEDLLASNRLWSRIDAENAVQSRQGISLEPVARFLRTNRWDIQALVAASPVRVSLLAATDHTALTEPDRSSLLDRLSKERVAVIESGHSIHRDRPGLWLHHVLNFTARV